MPISEVSFSSTLADVKSGSSEKPVVGFSSFLQKASENGSGFSVLTASPVSGGKSLLATEFWPERHAAKVSAAAERLGVDTEVLKVNFATISQKANDEGGYLDPKNFLKALSSEERAILQETQGLADPITPSDIDGLSEEGALNLLLPPGAQRDWNKDGLYSIGKGETFRFPTDSTPEHVRAAWEESTKDLPESEKWLAEGYMLPIFAGANMQFSEEGGAIGIHKPDSPQHTDPFKDMDFMDFVKNRLAWNESHKSLISPEQHERDKAFWSSFKNNLEQQQSA